MAVVEAVLGDLLDLLDRPRTSSEPDRSPRTRAMRRALERAPCRVETGAPGRWPS